MKVQIRIHVGQDQVREKLEIGLLQSQPPTNDTWATAEKKVSKAISEPHILQPSQNKQKAPLDHLPGKENE